MRIIGGHDYYDSALAFGRDNDIMFVRDGKEFKAKDVPLKWHNKSIFTNDRWFSDVDSGAHEVKLSDATRRTRFHRGVTVYAAGKVLYGVMVNDLYNFETVFWHYDKLEEYAVENHLKIAVPQHWDRRWVNDMSVKDRFTPRDVTREELDWMVDNRVAIAVGTANNNNDKENRVWHCNDAKDFALKNFRFQRAVDPYTMFQELSMFVGNWPKPGNPTVTITDDKVKVAKHGFDKWSFRRHADDN